MKKFFILNLCTLCFAAFANAQEGPYGPYPNYKGTKQVTGSIVIPTTSDVWLSDGLGHTYHIKSQGGQEFEIRYTAPVFVDSYAYFVPPPGLPFNPDRDPIILTEIFAYDLQPFLDPNLIPNQRGFNPTNPEIWPIGTSGFFIGQSGTVYPVPLEIVEVGMLPARLPGYDISKIQPPLSNKVFLLQGTVPSYDFVEKSFEFSYEYRGYITQSDPDWRGPKNPQYPLQHKWELLITNWSDVNMISDLDIEQPWVIYPGYIEIVPPPNWHDTGVTVGRYGYEANPGSEIQVGGGSLGVEWRVNGKVPAVVPGQVYLTTKKIPVSKIMPAMVPDNPDPHCGDWGYRDADLNKDCRVNFPDLALFALDWLKCSDPQGQDCSPSSIIGLGVAFNAEDSNYPATIVYLLDPGATPGLDVNDIIVEYQGVTIYSGAQLLGVISSLPPPAVGEPITMKVIKQSNGLSLTVTEFARLIPVVGQTTAFSHKVCQQYVGRVITCQCVSVTMNVTCSCGYDVKYSPFVGKYSAVSAFRTRCSDSNGNQCTGPWIYFR